MTRLGALAFAASFFVAAIAHAKVMPLERLPDDKLIALAPLLKHGDVALIESTPAGAMKQVTLMMYVAAPPEIMHDVIAHPGEYKHVIPNVTRSTWEPSGADTGVSAWKIELPVSSFEMVNAFKFEPGPTGAVFVTSPDPLDDATIRWEFLPASGGGTVLVQYGYSDVKHSNALVRSFLKRMPVTEHGLALAAQLLLATNMRAAAEKRARPGTITPPDAKARGPGFDFLLARGQVAVLRSLESGRLGDVSLLDRMYAPVSRIGELLSRPAEWGRFVPGVEESRERARGPGTVEWVADFAVPLMTWSTGWAMRYAERTYEGVGVSGDLAGAHFQWDLTPRGAGETLVVYRVNMSLAHSSLLARKMFQYEPSLEHGLNVAFSLVYLRAIRGKAEGWSN
ncbi:MAG TPA: hypothetical protein VFF06_34950 [Polyangia bacterium]|nr:hypothetical protein [Polyangia bacterium]